MLNSIVVQAETGDGSVSDFFNQTESIDQDDSELFIENVKLPATQQNNNNKQLSIPGLILRIIVVLVIIIGLIYLLLKLLNRSSNFTKQGEVLTNLGGISLGMNKSAQMLKVGDKIYLIGVGEDISILTEITDPATIEQLLEKQQVAPLSSSSFLEQFKLLGKKTKSTDESAQVDNTFENQDFASLFKGELDTMKEKREKIRVKHKEEE